MEYQLKLLKKTYLKDDVIISDFEVAEGGPLKFESGQFLVTKLPVDDGYVYRSYSMFSPAEDSEKIQFLFRYIAGPGTTYLKNMQEGEILVARGPVGNFRLKDKKATEVFVATGTGIAPIHAMIESRLSQENAPEMHLVFGTRTEEDLFLEETFGQWEEQMTIQRTLSQPGSDWKGLRGYVTEYLHAYPIEDVTYYICGSKAMIDDVRTLLEKRGVKKEDVHFERFY